MLESDLIRQYIDEMNVMLYGSSELSSLMGAVRAAVRYINYIYRDARIVELSYLYHLLSVSGQLLIVTFFASIGTGILKLLDRKILIFQGVVQIAVYIFVILRFSTA